LKILITGYSGFVGKHIEKYLFNYDIFRYNFRTNQKYIPENIDVFLHLAGKAHDLKNTTDVSDYYKVNTELTKEIYNIFLNSKATVFIFLSSIKAAADNSNHILTEEIEPNPLTHYGKSKLLAEEYILNHNALNKRIYILRPTMIHGPGNKGNLNLLYSFVKKGNIWPFGAFNNKRSYCSIDNLCFIINELIQNNNIVSGIYNISDDDSISTNELIKLISINSKKSIKIYDIPTVIIIIIAKIGNIINLPINSERLEKITSNYIVSNSKIKIAIAKPLPLSLKDGFIKTFNSFN
jgi:nucleoside-diphosphate-sugar epimerase